MAKIGPKEQRARELREQRAGKTPKAPAPPAAEPQETTMPKKKPTKRKTAKAKAKRKTAVKRTSKPKTPTASTASTRADGLREGSKQAIMLDMALATGGATEAAICKVLDWKKCRVTLKRVAEKVGAVLTQSKNDKGETVWSATMPPAKAAA